MTTKESFAALWSFCTEKDRIVPKDWNKLYKRLTNKRQLPSGGWEPALPLILAAWHETSSFEKQARFKEHIQWALEQNQIEQIGIYLRSLGEDGWYHIDEL
jgi:hypothetical protein